MFTLDELRILASVLNANLRVGNSAKAVPARLKLMDKLRQDIARLEKRAIEEWEEQNGIKQRHGDYHDW